MLVLPSDEVLIQLRMRVTADLDVWHLHPKEITNTQASKCNGGSKISILNLHPIWKPVYLIMHPGWINRLFRVSLGGTKYFTRLELLSEDEL